MGSKGVLEVASERLAFSPQSGKDEGPSGYTNGFPKAMHEAYEKKWHEQHDPPLGREPIAEATLYHGTNYNEVKPHLWNFFQAVKSRKPVMEDAVFGHHAALACHMANESYFRKSAVRWDEKAGMIRT
jgi:hypothetical protein